MYFKQEGSINSQRGRPLKSVDNFGYFVSKISSNENDVNIRLAKAWTAVDRLSIIRNSDLSNKMKWDSCGCVDTIYGCTR